MIKTKKQTYHFILIFLSFFFLYLFLSRSILSGGDDLTYLEIAGNFITKGVFKKTDEISGELKKTKYSLGQSLINLPVALNYQKKSEAELERNFTRYTFHTFIIAIWASFIAALEVAVFYRICLALGFTPAIGVLTSLSFGMGTMILVYSQRLFADTTLGFLWLLAFMWLNMYQTIRQIKFLLFAGFILGFSIITKPYAALFVLIFCMYFFWLLWLEIKCQCAGSSQRISFIEIKKFIAEKRSSLWLKLFVFLFPILIFIVLQLYYNYWRYNDFLKFGYDAVGVDKYIGFSNPVLVGLFGLLFSPGKGVLWYNPILFLSIPGFWYFYQKTKDKAIFLGILIIVYFLFISRWVGWHGDFSWGPRFLMSILPFLALPLGFFYQTLFEDFRKSLAKKATKYFFVIILFFLSLSIQVIGIIPDNIQYIVYVRDRIKIFPHSDYIPKVWPLRDTEFMMHYVPEFSPIVGHIWMINVIRHRDSNTFSHYLNNPPWRGLNEKWVPRGQNKNHFRYNIWWLTAMQAKHPYGIQILLFAYTLFAISVFGFYIIIRLLIIDFMTNNIN